MIICFETLQIMWKKYWKYDVTFVSLTILQAFQFEPEQMTFVVMRAMRKKLNISTLQLPIYYLLELEILIGANADIGKTRREK